MRLPPAAERRGVERGRGGGGSSERQRVAVAERQKQSGRGERQGQVETGGGKRDEKRAVEERERG